MIRSFLVHESPLPIGAPAPEVSLTSDDGRWVQSPDLKGRKHVVLVFFRNSSHEGARSLLADFDQQVAAIEGLDAMLYGICQDRPDRLREHRDSLDLGFPLLYDLLAMTSRQFRQAGRRPYVREGVVVIDKQGAVAAHWRPPVTAEQVLDKLRELEGVHVSAGREEGLRTIDWSSAQRLLDMKSGYVVLDVRTKGEFDAIHVPGAVHISVDELPQRYRELGTTTQVLTLCQTGDRSRQAGDFLVSMGFTDVYNVEGGMAEFSGNGET